MPFLFNCFQSVNYLFIVYCLVVKDFLCYLLLNAYQGQVKTGDVLFVRKRKDACLRFILLLSFSTERMDEIL